MQTATTMPGRYYPAIFVLASATLAYQILITRFFSVMVHYHFAFGAIALAMFGLTRGAMKVYEDSTRYAPERVAPEFARHAARFAISCVAVMCAFLYAPLVVPDAYAMSALAVVALAFTIPFAEGGICITLLLTRLPYVGGWLYAADLVGAAVGCLGIIFVLLVIDPVSATLWIGACSAAVGWFVVGHGEGRSDVRLSRNTALGLAALAAVHTALAATGSSHLGVIWAKGTQQTGTLFERWNTYSRIRVTDLGLTIPFGWSFSRTPDTRIEQLYLDIDADAATPITRFSGDLTKVSYLKDDVINAPYLVQQRPGDVAVVGVGGGRDILSGLYFGAQRIHGIEINPAIFEVLTDKFADYSGHLHRQPGVSLVNAEARSYINHSPDRYDLIQISLIDTWAATAAGGLTLTENRLYTVEAWDDFFRALKPGGMLSVSRWYEPTVYRGEFYRLIAIAAEALQHQGVPMTELSQHVIAANVGSIVTVMTRPEAFTAAQWRGARDRLVAQGFKLLLGPDIAYDSVTSTLLSGKADQSFLDSLPENIAASTDDKPFFFYTARLADLFLKNGFEAQNNAALGIIKWVLVFQLGICIYYIGIPFTRLMRRMPVATLVPPVAYFAAIGMGFMLIEISQMQRLMVFLGHPVYGLSVVLFTILLFGGIGSATVGAAPSRPAMLIARLVALGATLVAAGLLTPAVTAWARSAPTDIRILVSVALLAPPAFCMGMMFPLGLGIWRRHDGLLPFFWSTNGITSMLASVLGMALSIQFGITTTFALGVCCYVVCAIMIVGNRLAHPVADTALKPVRAAGLVAQDEVAS
ncbi:spermidine synthase [Bradyrhizobium sp. USDA 4341]